nr:MAG TPA: hypothetical protein [Caudoviricetes sp.]
MHTYHCNSGKYCGIMAVELSLILLFRTVRILYRSLKTLFG